MITPAHLLDFAIDQVDRAEGSEVSARRAISAAYYFLFHSIAQAGAALLKAPQAVRDDLARSYDHSGLSIAAKNLQKLASQTEVDPRLIQIAGSVQRLREAREKADYDLTARLTWDEADELVNEALFASNLLAQIASEPAAAEFLLSPLIQKRSRRG